MKNLRYNPYLNITDKEYKNLCKILEDFENRMALVVEKDDCLIKKPIKDADGLAISFYKICKSFKGTLAVVFDDIKHKITFSSTIALFMDIGPSRYIICHHIFDSKDIEYIDDNLEKSMFDALKIFNSWDVEIHDPIKKLWIKR